MNKKQKHMRTIVDVEGEELIERLTFYYSIIPAKQEELLSIVNQEFPLVANKDIKFITKAGGSLDIIPKSPQSRPEDLRKKQYLIKRDKQKSVATIVVHSEGRKLSLLSEIRNLAEFQTVNIIYEPSLLIDL